MKDYIEERVLEVSQHIAETGDTVRKTAELFGVSKSTIHKDVTERLPKLDLSLSKEVRRVLDFNKSVRHIRGGQATRRKYRASGDNER